MYNSKFFDALLKTKYADKLKKKAKKKSKKMPLSLVTHHWGGNRLKGFDVYEYIDKLPGVR